MYNDVIGLFIFFIAVITSAIIWHKKVADFWSANIGSVITIIVLVHLSDYLIYGYLNAFYPITIITTGAITLLISYIMGSSKKQTNEKN